ncbi:hypothetical protein THAOC_17332 [Thalassiosira oceanica]|uniref:Amino acid transporter transmembrane domain-containing protein n=1 Tax=Thalassiosira oceanica TaxID=159749 RepID=K0S9W8_THAOC|nr:hypothetical protein THAOC_17332 [Thalassiosira oceanica]|eukprot:EJK62070.1 hypothetical protein THAOC_17332 [Thalassiosira oceanica]
MSQSTKSPFFAPRKKSNPDLFDPDLFDDTDIDARDFIEPEHKSTRLGCTANLITAIVGAGIIGIPYAMKEIGVVAGVFLIILSGVLGRTSLVMLVETAKFVDASSYELLCEIAFQRVGWNVCNLMMFLMSFGPMLSYLMIVKDTLGRILPEYDSNTSLVVTSLLIILPVSMQRDMADLARTSRISVMFNITMVSLIAWHSPSSETLQEKGGLIKVLEESTFRPSTCAIGLGVVSFAFSCQHSSLIIAGSLKDPTKERWGNVTSWALTFCVVLALVQGSFGYLGFTNQTEGNILNNFPTIIEATQEELHRARAANIASMLLCGTMFFVYPLESFVCRHVVMTNLFKGRAAHEGDDHAVLDRWDRRGAATVLLYLAALFPALEYNDVGIVLSLTGTVAASTLSYIMPGLLYIGIYGDQFLALASQWRSKLESSILLHIAWHVLLMPVWTRVASVGLEGQAKYDVKVSAMTPSNEYRLGKVKHKRIGSACLSQRRKARSSSFSDFGSCDASKVPDPITDQLIKSPGGLATAALEGESYGATDVTGFVSPSNFPPRIEPVVQEDKKGAWSFVVAILFVLFGAVAFVTGIMSMFSHEL